MSRTIVLSDLHGHASLLEAALQHAGFGDGDRLVIAGDLVDIGSDDTVGLARSLGATILAGNHEVAAALGLAITPQNPETRERGPEFARLFVSGEWPLATHVDGWVITHAGLSATLDDLVRPSGGDPFAVVEMLNLKFAEEMADATSHGDAAWSQLERYRLVGGQMGPLWFRPRRESDLLGMRQIAGHTPAEAYPRDVVERFASLGLLLVDAGAHLRPEPGRFRYAVIEDGSARVVDSREQ